MTGEIGNFYIGSPPGWFAWNIGEAAARCDDLVASVSDGGIRRALRERILSIDSSVGKNGAMLWAGLWVPEPATGGVLAVARVELLVLQSDRPAVRDEVLAERNADPFEAFKVFDRAVIPIDIPAGPAVVEAMVMAERPRGVLRRLAGAAVESRVVYTIVPEGSGEGLRLEVLTDRPDVIDDLVEQAARLADTVTVVVRESQ